MSNAYLTVQNGQRAGSNYSLDAKDETLIGRGLDCQIMLTDPLSSRVHAVVLHDDERTLGVIETRSSPPWGIASAAFTIRFRKTCSRRSASPMVGGTASKTRTTWIACLRSFSRKNSRA